jgi:hypothetical protein
MDWKASLDWTNGLLSAATSWIEAHPGTANWIQAFGSIAAIVAVFLFVVLQNRGAKSREETDRIRRAQGLALLLIPILSSFELEIETAIIQECEIAPPDEVIHLLNQLYIIGVAGGYILQMVAILQAHQRFGPIEASESETEARAAHNSLARKRLSIAQHYCEDAIRAMTKLTQVRTV